MGAVRVFANVLGRVKCPERRQSTGGRLPWRASREEEGQVQPPPQGQEERTGRGLKPRQAAGGQGGGAAPCQCLGSQGPAGRRWLGGQRRAWLGFDNHSSAKVAFPVGQEGLLVVSSNGSQSPHQDESV